MTDTPDSETKKGILNGLHALVRGIAHVALVPVVAATGALAHFFQHLHDEIAKV